MERVGFLVPKFLYVVGGCVLWISEMGISGATSRRPLPAGLRMQTWGSGAKLDYLRIWRSGDADSDELTIGALAVYLPIVLHYSSVHLLIPSQYSRLRFVGMP